MLADVIKNLPTRKNELWKYTSLKPLQEVNWAHATGESGLSHDELKKISSWLSAESINYVFVNGTLNKTLSDPFESWVKEETQSVLNYTGSDVSLKDLYLTTPGKKIKINIPAKLVVDKPVQILFVQHGDQQIVQHIQIELVIATHAQLKMATKAVSLSDAASLRSRFCLLQRHPRGIPLPLQMLWVKRVYATHLRQSVTKKNPIPTPAPRRKQLCTC